MSKYLDGMNRIFEIPKINGKQINNPENRVASITLSF